jgi:hypothetical protein
VVIPFFEMPHIKKKKFEKKRKKMDKSIKLQLKKPLDTCFNRLRAHIPSHGALADGSRAHGH